MLRELSKAPPEHRALLTVIRDESNMEEQAPKIGWHHGPAQAQQWEGLALSEIPELPRETYNPFLFWASVVTSIKWGPQSLSCPPPWKGKLLID